MMFNVVFVALWIAAQLGTNALLCLSFDPKGSLVLPLVSVLAGNMVLTVLGWEMSQGRTLLPAKKKKGAAPPRPAMPRVLFVKLEHDERGDWYSAWNGLAHLLGASHVESEHVAIYRLKEVKPVEQIMRQLTP